MCKLPKKDVYKRNILVHIKKLSGIKLLRVTLGSNPTYWSLILTRSSNSSNMKIFLNLWSGISLSIFFISEAGLLQWWECLPPINVARVRFLSSCHMWVEFVVGSHLASCCFLEVLWFSSLHKKTSQNFNLIRTEDPLRLNKYSL